MVDPCHTHKKLEGKKKTTRSPRTDGRTCHQGGQNSSIIDKIQDSTSKEVFGDRKIIFKELSSFVCGIIINSLLVFVFLSLYPLPFVDGPC